MLDVIEDTSTNWTYLKGKLLGRDNKRILNLYDEITFSDDVPNGVRYVFEPYDVIENEIKEGVPQNEYEIVDFIGQEHQQWCISIRI